MSDEANAPSNGASDTALPNQTTTEAPAQAAPVVQADDKPASSAREALERAFKKVETPAPATEAKPASPNRDPATGQFAPKAADPKPAEKPAEATQADPQKPPVVEKPAEVKPVTPAPQRFAKAAQEAWAQTPETVRLETERAITELTRGLEQYRTEAEAFAPLKQFDAMAKAGGTTLHQAMANYVNLENVLRRDPIAGMVTVCRNLGIDPAAIGAALAGIQPQQVQAILAQQQMQQAQAQQQQPAQQQPQSDPVQEAVAQMRVEMAYKEFVRDTPDFDKHKDILAPTMRKLLEAEMAKDLPDAFAQALRLNPEVAAKIEAEKAAKAAPQQVQTSQPDPAQTRQKAALSISGSPSPGSHPATRPPAGSARDALKNAFAQVGLG